MSLSWVSRVNPRRDPEPWLGSVRGVLKSWPVRTSRRCAAAGASAAVAGLVLSAGCSASSSTSAPTSTAPASGGASSSAAAQAATRIELRFVGGAVVGGVARQAVPLGSTVQLVVSSDVADEVHLHGYDRKVDVPAGGTATLSLVANVPGVFDVELESRSKLLMRLEVR